MTFFCMHGKQVAEPGCDWPDPVIFNRIGSGSAQNVRTETTGKQQQQEYSCIHRGASTVKDNYAIFLFD